MLTVPRRVRPRMGDEIGVMSGVRKSGMEELRYEIRIIPMTSIRF